MKTGNTWVDMLGKLGLKLPQWSPVMKTGNTRLPCAGSGRPSSLNGARS